MSIPTNRIVNRLQRGGYMVLFAVLSTACTFLYSCSQTSEDHAHEEEHSSNAEPVSVDTTIWTDNIELFVEFRALVVGQPSRFAAHFTVLNGHQPVREGSITVSLIKDGKGIRTTAKQPSAPGIFTPTLQPKEPGSYTLLFELQSAAINDKIQIKDVQVYSSQEEANKALGSKEEVGGTISFLKEQAWKIAFYTDKVRAAGVYDLIRTSGRWQPAPGAERTVQASSDGVVAFKSGLLVEGVQVQRGSLLATISGEGLTSGNITIELAKARSLYEQTEAEFTRKQRLLERQVVSKGDFEDVKKRYEIAKAEYENLAANYRSGAKQINAPLSGYVKRVFARNGDFVRAGAPLLVIGVQHPVLLKVDVPVQHYSKLTAIRDVWFTNPNGQWVNLNDIGGSLTSVGKAVSDVQPLIPVYFQAGMSQGIVEGSFTEVQIAAGETRSGISIPSSALLEEFGQYSVIVQLSGETFEKRPVRIGVHNGPLVEILDGLQVDEHIVTTGAYQVKMASMAGQIPAHGHSH